MEYNKIKIKNCSTKNAKIKSYQKFTISTNETINIKKFSNIKKFKKLLFKKIKFY